MNKKTIVGGIVIVGIVAAILVLSGDMAPQADPAPAVVQENNSAAAGNEVVRTAQAGSYEPYAPEKIALAESGKVVLFFRASWCPTCRVLDANIRANLDDIPAGVAILDVDYDNSEDLKRKYNVTYQHTLVQVDANGNQIAKWSGSPSLSGILANLK